MRNLDWGVLIRQFRQRSSNRQIFQIYTVCTGYTLRCRWLHTVYSLIRNLGSHWICWFSLIWRYDDTVHNAHLQENAHNEFGHFDNDHQIAKIIYSITEFSGYTVWDLLYQEPKGHKVYNWNLWKYQFIAERFVLTAVNIQRRIVWN